MDLPAKFGDPSVLGSGKDKITKLIKYFQEGPKMGQLTSIPNLVILG